MNAMVRNVLLSLGVAMVLTATGLAFVLSPEDAKSHVPRQQTVAVLVAAMPVEAGQRIDKVQIGWRAVPADKVPDGALRRDGKAELELIGAIAQRNLTLGELFTAQSFVKVPAARTLATSLNPGWRAITISADASQTAAGMLLPNDRVDLLIATIKDEGSTPKITLPFAKMGGPSLAGGGTVVANVRVIAINGLMAPSDPASGIVDDSAKSGGTITLEVPSEQVGPIFSAASNGQLVIALRSRLDNAGPPARIEPASGGRSAGAGKLRNGGAAVVASPAIPSGGDPASALLPGSSLSEPALSGVEIIRGAGSPRGK